MPGSNRFLTFIRKGLRAEDGNIFVLAACCMTFLCGLMAIGLDAGHVMYIQRQLQTFADAAALAGALEIGSCGNTSNCTAMQSAAKSALTENGVNWVTLGDAVREQQR